MDVIYLIGRILFALILVGSAFGHLTDPSSVDYAESKGVPNARPLVLLSGVGLLAGGIGIILGIWIDLAFLGMAALVLIIAFMMHRFWAEGAETQQVEMSMFMKNMSIAGGALGMFALAHTLEDSPLSLTDLLF